MTGQIKLRFSRHEMSCGAVVFVALLTGLALYFLPARQRTYTPTPRIEASNNLKMIGLAMLNYADLYKTLPPPAIYSKDRKPLLSWRVLILPFIEEQNLHAKFHLDEPWDSSHNLALLKHMPPIYEHPRDKAANAKNLTCFRIFVGPGTAFEGPKGIAPHDFPDGAGSTLLVVEAAEGVPWTKPADFAYAPEGELPKLGGRLKDHFHVLMADASVQFVPQTVTEDRLRAAITRNGGEQLTLTDE